MGGWKASFSQRRRFLERTLFEGARLIARAVGWGPVCQHPGPEWTTVQEEEIGSRARLWAPANGF